MNARRGTGEQHLLTTLLFAIVFSSCAARAQSNSQLVRLAVIEVDTAHLDSYHHYLKEEIEASIRLEPGVKTLYGVAEKNHPERVTLFETYGDSNQYRSHLTTAHFQKYKKATLSMVNHLELIEAESIFYIRRPELSSVPGENLFVRLIKMDLDPSRVDNFKALAQRVLLPGIKKEPGVLVMYAVAEKKRPAKLSILEVYASHAAYEMHRNMAHFLQYKTQSKEMVYSLTIIDVLPILLGSKSQQ
jgi:4-carboxymuconolactone decarboxylase